MHNGLKLRCSASTVPNACDRDDLVSVVNPVNEAVRTDDGFADKGVLFLRNHLKQHRFSRRAHVVIKRWPGPFPGHDTSSAISESSFFKNLSHSLCR